MRNRYLIANWKMNLPPEGISAYLEEVWRRSLRPPDQGGRSDRPYTVIAPPFPYLQDVAGSRIAAAAQNCAEHKSGAFTGEVSPWMLADLGVKYVIVGHSERRSIYGENDALLQRKLSAAIEAGLTPVLCVGED